MVAERKQERQNGSHHEMYEKESGYIYHTDNSLAYVQVENTKTNGFCFRKILNCQAMSTTIKPNTRHQNQFSFFFSGLGTGFGFVTEEHFPLSESKCTYTWRWRSLLKQIEVSFLTPIVIWNAIRVKVFVSFDSA